MDYRMLVAIVLVIGCTLIVQIQAFKQPTCRGKETKLTVDELKTITDCLKEFNKGGSSSFSDIPKDSMGCVGKCMLQRQGLVGPDGKPLKENVFKMVNETMDPEVVQIADEKVGKCIDDTAPGIDGSEQGCKTYWPLVQCVAAAFMQICFDPAASTESKS